MTSPDRPSGTGAGVSAANSRPALWRGDTPWFHRYVTHAPKLRLICFPHAGGTAAFFRPWAGRLPADVELVAVQYPGRQDRLKEPVPASIEDLADIVAGHLDPLLDLSVALFGHSMGASIAYEVARRIEAHCDLRLLFVSGSVAPGGGPPGEEHLLHDEELIHCTVERGGPNSDAYQVPALRPLLMPSLRADRRLVDTYRPVRVPVLRTAVVAFGGDADQGCPPEKLQTWQEVSPKPLDTHVFPGGHFYLHGQEDQVVGQIIDRLIG